MNRRRWTRYDTCPAVWERIDGWRIHTGGMIRSPDGAVETWCCRIDVPADVRRAHRLEPLRRHRALIRLVEDRHPLTEVAP